MNKIEFQDYPSTETPLNAENLNKMQTNIENEIKDSGWIYPTLNSGWVSQYSQAPTRYRKIGKVVFLESFVDGTAEAPATIFTLPAEFKPTAQYFRYPVYCHGQTVIISIENTGNVNVLNKSGSLQWVSINTSFVVD